ncbi:hypothetical protein [Corallococcus macrosporus]|uniref:hypothetical protein n=1 Tax=Corallococcus macrosporus TaxID=35 RepID=UPI001EFD0408|nr:hypothetical protein [Corallococcus macrosporus]
MLNPHDRRDLASLGLMVLVYGLAAAPVLHAVVAHGGGGHHHPHHAHSHPHGHAHAHGAHTHSGGDGAEAPAPDDEQQRGHEHPAGSVEHLHAVAVAWAVMKPPRVREVSWLAEVQRGLSRAPGSAVRPTAMPQGP